MRKPSITFQCAVGVLPLGTGNDLSRVLHCGGSYKPRIDRLHERPTLHVNRHVNTSKLHGGRLSLTAGNLHSPTRRVRARSFDFASTLHDLQSHHTHPEHCLEHTMPSESSGESLLQRYCQQARERLLDRWTVAICRCRVPKIAGISLRKLFIEESLAFCQLRQ